MVIAVHETDVHGQMKKWTFYALKDTFGTHNNLSFTM